MTWCLGEFHLASARWYFANGVICLWLSLSGDSCMVAVCSYHPATSTNGHWHTDTELSSVAKLSEFRSNRALFSFYYHWNATNKYDSTTHRLCEAVKCEYTLHRIQWKLTSVTKRLSEHVIRGGMRKLVTSSRSGCAILSKQGAKIMHSYSLITMYRVMPLTIPSGRNVKALFCSTIPGIWETTALFGRSHASPALPTGKNSMSLKMSIGNWGKITERWSRSARIKNCPSATFSATNLIRTGTRSDALFRGETPSTNRPSHSTASPG